MIHFVVYYSVQLYSMVGGFAVYLSAIGSLLAFIMGQLQYTCGMGLAVETCFQDFLVICAAGSMGYFCSGFTPRAILRWGIDVCLLRMLWSSGHCNCSWFLLNSMYLC